MKYTLVWTKTFVRTARRFLRKHPNLRDELQLVLKRLEDDPEHPALRLHALKGRLHGKHAVSLTYSHRMILILALHKNEIVLSDIGSHDEVYR